MARWIPDAGQAPTDEAGRSWAVKIFTLGRFEIVQDGQLLRFSGKIQRRPLALLKAIIAFGGRNVREERLIDTLWPDAHGDAARFSFTSALHRLRRLLGQREIVVRKDGKLSLNTQICWVDVWEVERLLDRVEAIPVARDGKKIFFTETMDLVRQAVALYQGAFLYGESDAPWASAFADQVRRRLLRQLAAMGERSQSTEEWTEAALWYEKGLSVDPCAEDVCRCLMIAYSKLCRTGEIMRIYRHCRESLRTLAGITPSAMTEELLKQFLTER